MNINHNNRPPLVIPLAAISATLEQLLLVAHKKTRIKKASFLQDGAISVDAVNYLSFQLAKDEVSVGSAVTTEAGLADRASLDLDLGSDGYIDLEIGEVLSLDVTEAGTFAEGAAGLLVLDLEIIGN